MMINAETMLYVRLFFEKTKGLTFCIILLIGYCILGAFLDKIDEKEKMDRGFSDYDWLHNKQKKSKKKSKFFNKKK